MPRNENSTWLYDDPYEPYQPRSIFRKKAEPPPPDVGEAAAEAPQSPLTPCCRQTKIRIEKRFKRFLDAMVSALRPHTEAHKAIHSVIAEFAGEELREDGPLDPQPRAA